MRVLGCHARREVASAPMTDRPANRRRYYRSQT
jgi:hypothetical protein